LANTATPGLYFPPAVDPRRLGGTRRWKKDKDPTDQSPGGNPEPSGPSTIDVSQLMEMAGQITATGTGRPGGSQLDEFVHHQTGFMRQCNVSRVGR
jgi:hypothetical protein